MEAKGRETRGSGTANAVVTAQLDPDGDGTRVRVLTELKITGKVAQFGRGVMNDVADKILGQFAGCVAENLGRQ
jgi:carbon monoxide dehydrogenase subunit G